jgi:IS30 family transposase
MEQKKLFETSFEQRLEIERLLNEGQSLNTIARLIGKAKSTVLHEIQRCSPNHYTAIEAQKNRDDRNKKRAHFKPFTEKEISIINEFMATNASRSKIRHALKCNYCKLSDWLDEHHPSYKGGLMNNLEERLSNIEQQIEILFDILKENR